MKKTSLRTRNKIIRHVIVYLLCLSLAVLTWVLVKYAENEEKSDNSACVSACADEIDAYGAPVRDVL